MKEIIDDFLKKNPNIPDNYLLLLACDIDRRTYEKFKSYAQEKGLVDVNILTSSILEAELYARHPDILYTFFGIQTLGRRVAVMARIKRRIAIKKKVERELVQAMRGKVHDVIIHNVHRDIYPDSDLHTPGISPWFKLEYFRLYYKGISFYSNIVSVVVEQQSRNWRLVDYNSKIAKGWIKINAFQICNIPFDNIADIDVEGDEYYPFPHFYCELSNLGEPYEEIWYRPTDEFEKKGLLLPKKKRLK